MLDLMDDIQEKHGLGGFYQNDRKITEEEICVFRNLEYVCVRNQG